MASSLITVLNASNEPLPPVTLAEAQRKLQAGEYRADQLAYAEGLKAWTPLIDVIVHVAGTGAPAPVVTPPALTAPVAAAPVMTAPLSADGRPYAGFWMRFAAYLIDSIILSFVFYVPMALFMFIGNPSGFIHDMTTDGRNAMDAEPIWVQVMIFLWAITVLLTYFPCMESSEKQGTFGKMALGIIVTDLHGQRISYMHALGRTLGKLITNLTCCLFYIGYLMVGFTAKKQALHDMIAGTLVVRR